MRYTHLRAEDLASHSNIDRHLMSSRQRRLNARSILFFLTTSYTVDSMCEYFADMLKMPLKKGQKSP